MKKTLLYSYLYVLIISVSSCSKEDLAPSTQREFVFLDAPQTELFFVRGETNNYVDLSVFAVLHAAEREGDINYQFEILPSSSAEEGVHYSVEKYSGVIESGKIKDSLSIRVLPSMLVPCESRTLDIRLVSSDLEKTDFGTIRLSLNLESGSALAGFADYTHTDNFTGFELMGRVEISALENAGEYRLSDFSFGAWEEAYGIDPPKGSLKWSNNCQTIRLSGTDNYGDLWQMDEILMSGSDVFTFKWSNTYGEFGTVSLVRADGVPWPDLILE